jgi:hypothetical protein
MPGQRPSKVTVEELKQKLRVLSDEGAGIAELLDEVEKWNQPRRFKIRRRGFTIVQIEDLRRYSWGLQSAKPNGMLWGEARGLWGDSGALRTTRLGSRSPRRAQAG